jgi:hypothetical protein
MAAHVEPGVDFLAVVPEDQVDAQQARRLHNARAKFGCASDYMPVVDKNGVVQHREAGSNERATSGTRI